MIDLSEQLRSFNRDNAPHRVQCLHALGRQFAATTWTRVLARWWRIELGPDCKFRGLPIFRRAPKSRISIGRGCEFRSAKWSNLVGINRPCIISTLESGSFIDIGTECGFSGAVVGCAAEIRLGNRVMCGANTVITDTDWHPLDWRERLAGLPGGAAPVIIDDDVWLGMNVTVLKGVRIGARTVVGAGSIVSRSLPADVVAAGQPARVVRSLMGTRQDRGLEELLLGSGAAGD